MRKLFWMTTTRLVYATARVENILYIDTNSWASDCSLCQRRTHLHTSPTTFLHTQGIYDKTTTLSKSSKKEVPSTADGRQAIIIRSRNTHEIWIRTSENRTGHEAEIYLIDWKDLIQTATLHFYRILRLYRTIIMSHRYFDGKLSRSHSFQFSFYLSPKSAQRAFNVYKFFSD